jgi:hypothetical protein
LHASVWEEVKRQVNRLFARGAEPNWPRVHASKSTLSSAQSREHTIINKYNRSKAPFHCSREESRVRA